MFNKHFIKTLILFAIIILVGVVGVFVVSGFAGEGILATAIKSLGIFK
jgi:hypothetical protein